LFKAVVEQAGLMDMLRFHKFTIGSAWISDYGSSEQNEAQFKALYAYSPIHNVKPGTKYTEKLITTADHNDRVLPEYNFKYTPALPAANAPNDLRPASQSRPFCRMFPYFTAH
jgi:prolyl oligopeptidase